MIEGGSVPNRFFSGAVSENYAPEVWNGPKNVCRHPSDRGAPGGRRAGFYSLRARNSFGGREASSHTPLRVDAGRPIHCCPSDLLSVRGRYSKAGGGGLGGPELSWLTWPAGAAGWPVICAVAALLMRAPQQSTQRGGTAGLGLRENERGLSFASWWTWLDVVGKEESSTQMDNSPWEAYAGRGRLCTHAQLDRSLVGLVIVGGG